MVGVVTAVTSAITGAVVSVVVVELSEVVVVELSEVVLLELLDVFSFAEQEIIIVSPMQEISVMYKIFFIFSPIEVDPKSRTIFLMS